MRTASSAIAPIGSSTQVLNLGPFRAGMALDNIGYSLQDEDGFLSLYQGFLTAGISNQQQDTFDGSDILIPRMAIGLSSDSIFRLTWLYRVIGSKPWVQVRFESTAFDGTCLVAAFAACRPVRQQQELIR